MTQQAARITCPRCGANNFDTVTSCWKCHAPLGPGAAPQTIAPPQTGASPPITTYGAPEHLQRPHFTQASTVSAGDPGVARRAAIALGLTLPFIGLPVGWIFMMIEDERRQAIGRICAVWSMISLVLQLLFMFAFAQLLTPWVSALVGTAAKATQQSQSHDPSGGLPGLGQ